MNKIMPGVLLLGMGMVLLSCSPPQSNRPQTFLAEDTTNSLQLASGTVERFYVHSKFVDARNVDIWLPDDYQADQQYNVLYMHDGQMLFDSTKTWNHQEWKVDETLSRLRREGKIPPTIVVGIWNNDKKRADEYFPEKVMDDIPQPQRRRLKEVMADSAIADRYLDFMTQELKPFVDRRYTTYPGRDHTFVMGSSFGGLISVYAISEYPEVFGGAACLSTHWIGTFEANDAIPGAINDYLDKHLPSPGNHKLYFDHGTKTLDAHYPPYQDLIDRTVQAHGYTSEHWMSREFPGADHSEHSWAKRLEIPLTFLLH